MMHAYEVWGGVPYVRNERHGQRYLKALLPVIVCTPRTLEARYQIANEDNIHEMRETRGEFLRVRSLV